MIGGADMSLFCKKKSQEPVEIHELIFCPLGSQEDILSQLEQVFGIPSGHTGNQITLQRNDMLLAFAVYTTEDEGDEGTYAQEQLRGVWSYFRQTETEHLEIQRNVLHHLRMCHSVIRVYAKYDGPKNPDKENEINTKIWQAALPIHGLLTQGTDILCDAVGRPIFDKQGHSDFEYYMPPKYPLPDDWRQHVPEDCARRDRSINVLDEKHLYAPSFLPLLGTGEKDPSHTLREMCGRAAALLAVSLYSECRLSEKMSYDEAKAFIQPIVDSYRAEEFFSPSEQDYLNNSNSSEQEQVQFVWQYENLWVMEWALGLHEDLFWPDHICDVPASVRLMQAYSHMDELLAAVKPRPRKELLDQADLIYLLHWACVDARVNGLPAPQGLDEGVVMERHRALFWLAGCDDCCRWDDVDLST